MMLDDLDILIEDMTAHLSHVHHRPIAEVRPSVRALVHESRQEYRDAGAPYGDTATGFLRWLLDRMPNRRST